MLSYNAENYLYGKGRLYFKPVNETGYLDLGNVPKLEIKPTVTKKEHYSSRDGAKLLDLNPVDTVKMSADFDLEEYSSENLNLAFLGDGVDESSQSASMVSGAAITIVADRFVDLGKVNISSVKLTHGAITGGTFAVGNTVVGADSAAEGKIGWFDTGFVELYNVTGTFESSEVIACAGVSATTTAAEVQEDIIVTDAASPTARYVAGEDYNVDVEGGLLRALSTGDIETTAYVSYDYALTAIQTVAALANTECQGELKFIGTPDTGPKFQVTAWKVNLTISGSVGLISDDITAIGMTADILDDSTNHASCPFLQIKNLA